MPSAISYHDMLVDYMLCENRKKILLMRLYELICIQIYFVGSGIIYQLCPGLLVQIELDDPLENVGVKLVRQAGARTNDLAGDGCTTSIVLAQGLIAEGLKAWFF